MRIRRVVESALMIFGCVAPISATPPPQEPGVGVLCLGTFIYFVEKNGAECRSGQDPEFQARVANYARRFDEYIVRNTGGDPVTLVRFKEGQNLNSEDSDYICSGDVAESYILFRNISTEVLDGAVADLLARDGRPTFGDCV